MTNKTTKKSHLRFARARFGWSSITSMIIHRAGGRLNRWRPRSVARRRRLNEWVKKTEVDSGKRGGVPTDVAEKLKALERDNRELRQANEILRKASAYFAQAELDREAEEEWGTGIA
jgi:transposase